MSPPIFGLGNMEATLKTCLVRRNRLFVTKMNDFVFHLSGIYGTKGTGTTSTVPGSRYSSATWSDSNENLWLFGGYGSAVSLVGMI